MKDVLLWEKYESLGFLEFILLNIRFILSNESVFF